jgi:hypothetical protein
MDSPTDVITPAVSRVMWTVTAVASVGHFFVVAEVGVADLARTGEDFGGTGLPAFPLCGATVTTIETRDWRV